MKYGYISDMQQLDTVDFTLPPDSEASLSILQQHKSTFPHQQPKVYIGCAEYRVREWIGTLYPPGTRESDMLERYINAFNVMEMNGTHYKIYDPAQIHRWTEKAAGKDFLFLPKFPQAISHHSNSFTQLEELTNAFLQSIDAFRPHLGSLFLQLSEYYDAGSRRQLFRYLAALPEGYTYFLELRHPQWFLDQEARTDLFAALRDMGIGALITDTPGHREVVHMELTIPKTFIRFVGKHSHPTTQHRIDAWMQRIKTWQDAGLQEAYFIVHTGLSAPVTSVYAIERANAVLQSNIPVPELYQSQQGQLNF